MISTESKVTENEPDDFLLTVAICTRNRVRFLEKVVYHNRKHSGSLTTTFDPLKPRGLFDVIEALKYVRRFLCEFYYDEDVDKAIDNSKVYHSALYFMRACESEGGSMRDTFRKLYP